MGGKVSFIYMFDKVGGSQRRPSFSMNNSVKQSIKKVVKSLFFLSGIGKFARLYIIPISAHIFASFDDTFVIT